MNGKSKLVFLLITIFAPVGFAIKCWDCNSLINGRCADPFNSEDFAMADCSQKHLPRFPDMVGHFCRKTTQRINNEVRIIRGCGYLNDTFNPNDEDSRGAKGECTRKTGTFSVMVEYCSCHGRDGCNGANRQLSVITPIIVLLTLLGTVQFLF